MRQGLGRRHIATMPKKPTEDWVECPAPGLEDINILAQVKAQWDVFASASGVEGPKARSVKGKTTERDRLESQAAKMVIHVTKLPAHLEPVAKSVKDELLVGLSYEEQMQTLDTLYKHLAGDLKTAHESEVQQQRLSIVEQELAVATREHTIAAQDKEQQQAKYNELLKFHKSRVSAHKIQNESRKAAELVKWVPENLSWNQAPVPAPEPAAKRGRSPSRGAPLMRCDTGGSLVMDDDLGTSHATYERLEMRVMKAIMDDGKIDKEERLAIKAFMKSHGNMHTDVLEKILSDLTPPWTMEEYYLGERDMDP